MGSFLWILGSFLLLEVTSAPVGETDYITLLEKEAGAIPDSDMADDTLLHQEIIQGHTIYRYPHSEKHGAPVFIRPGSDVDKGVVVLKTGEDYLPACSSQKNTYVVMKQSGKVKNHYKVFYGYVR